MTPPRRALISITSAHATLFQGKVTTGLFISEALHPYKVFTAAGFEVDLTSETGTYTPDWLSQQPDFLNGEDLATWQDANSEFQKKLDNMPKAADIDGSRYGIFYAGHAALIDYPTASNLQKIAAQVWANGGIVSAVCHGPALFANLLDPATNEPIIKGKTITGFTTEAEITMGIMEELQSWGNDMIDGMAAKLGAKFAVPPSAPLRPQALKEQNDEYRTGTDAHAVERFWHEDYETGMRDNATKSESIHTLDILDLTSIIKSSRIISSEINVDTLLKKMIEIFINTTRAEIGAVIVHEDSKFRVAAMGTMNSVESFKYPHMSLESLENTVFSEPISYALNTSETVVISNTAEDERFLGASLRWQKCHADGRSILVHPVRHKNIVLGALYLEGAPHSFNTRHIEVLALLSQQMGISITNAMLFKNIRKATMANAMMIERQNAALKAARESEARFVATLETMPCIIWTADPPSASAPIDKAPPLDYLNNFWYIFCGSDAPGPANDAYLLQFHEDDREVFVGALINAKCGTYETIEVRIRDAMGNYRWHVCRCTALKSDESVITKWIGALINIDDQRRAQEEALNAMRLKEEASRMKSEFLANMSHEIRTPIAGVIGMSDLLLGTDLQPEQRNFADNIRLCADALLTVITDVLDFSKIEVGKLELSNVPFDVTCVLKETLKILSFPIAKKGLRLIDDIHFSLEPMPLVMGDPGRFRQIAMNLLTNGVKFTSSGHITLTARDGYETDDIIEVKVQISDTGIGISKAVMSKLFLPFEQGDNSTARQFGGTGLGLSISKNLVELMNGTIGLESEHGKGTTAHFTVPFVKAPVDLKQSSYIDEASSLVAWDAGPKSYPHLVDVPSAVSVASLPEIAEGYTQEPKYIWILVVEDNLKLHSIF
ncbi:hypothetical protein V1508DRAFT_114346 [Lipomyces doorenjongii]|uniref:uncharacterized protein n=1 Tax=Lipomyces doorenjongii TaxID=383834 RepID=UPI0034CF1BB6